MSRTHSGFQWNTDSLAMLPTDEKPFDYSQTGAYANDFASSLAFHLPTADLNPSSPEMQPSSPEMELELHSSRSPEPFESVAARRPTTSKTPEPAPVPPTAPMDVAKKEVKVSLSFVLVRVADERIWCTSLLLHL